MRTTRFALACVLAAALGVSGCYESLTSIVTPDKLVYYDELPGEYKAVEPAAGRVTIEKAADKAYAYRQHDEKGVLQNKGTLRVVKLGDEHFYEITAEGLTTLEGKPLYFVGRLTVDGEKGARTLTGHAFESKDAFFDAPEVTTTEYRYKEGGEEKKGRALSMPAEKLQAYLSANAGKMTERGLRLKQTVADR